MHEGFVTTPAKTLESLYQDVYEQNMKGLPICNEAINIEAIGFHLWENQWLGILITPWFTNLLILRQQGQHWPEFTLAKGNEQWIEFPVGTIKFTPRFEPQLGQYLCCSLVSPMNDCPSHQQAVSDAKNALRQLTQIPINRQTVAENHGIEINADMTNTLAMASTEHKPMPPILTEPQQARRSFLRGKRQLAL